MPDRKNVAIHGAKELKRSIEKMPEKKPEAKINRAKNVKEIVGKMLEENGFVYSRSGMYLQYDRETRGRKETIYFVGIPMIKGYITAGFTIPGVGGFGFENFVPKEEISRHQRHWALYWRYENKEQLKEILQQFREWIEKYGFPYMEDLIRKEEAKPPEPQITEEMERELYSRHEEIYQRYKEEWGMQKASESIPILEEKVEELYGEEFGKVKGRLMEYAAVYGYALCIGDAGEWQWDEDEKCSVVRLKEGIRWEERPLEIIIKSFHYQGKGWNIRTEYEGMQAEVTEQQLRKKMEELQMPEKVNMIVGGMLEKKGFRCEAMGLWPWYAREKDGYTQYIRGDMGRLLCLRLFFSTDEHLYEQKGFEFMDIVPEIAGNREYWECGSEEELKNVLEQFCIWIEEYGLAFLDRLCTPGIKRKIKPEADAEEERYLYSHHEEIYRKYQKEWQTEDTEKTMEILCEKIRELQELHFWDAKEKLMEYAAVYGHALCADSMGNWEWDEEKKRCALKNPEGLGRRKDTDMIYPFQLMFAAYETEPEALKKDFSFYKD